MAVITPDNVISKLCYAIHGKAGADEMKALKTTLADNAEALRDNGQSAPSRQAIHKWFQSGSNPTRASGHGLILAVVLQAQDRAANFGRAADQSKVLRQIRKFCERSTHDVRNRIIHGQRNGSLITRTETIYNRKQYTTESEKFEGYYNCYKRRFDDLDSEDVSIEAMRIYKINSMLYVDWWYLLDRSKVEKFECAMFFSGKWAWIKVYNPQLEGRFRTAVFDKTGWGRICPDEHIGIISSTTPHPRDATAVSAKFFIERTDSPPVDSRIQDRVMHQPASHIEETRGADFLSKLRSSGVFNQPISI